MDILLLLFLIMGVIAQPKGNGAQHGLIQSALESCQTNQLKDLIPENYSVFDLPPTLNDRPLLVNMSFYIRGLWDVDEAQELITLNLKLLMFWKDTRLIDAFSDPNNDDRRLKLELLNYIWHPDVDIYNVKTIEHVSLISKLGSLRIFRDGTLRYSTRVSVTLSCSMDFTFYPLDIQACPIQIRNYGFRKKEVDLGWAEEGFALNVDAKLSNFNLTAAKKKYKLVIRTETGEIFAGLSFAIILRRLSGYHLLQTYLPSTIMIFVSWLSFILPYNATIERMGFSMTCLFTLTSMFASVRQNTPNVNYIKALDIWMLACVFFVFLTLLQHAILNKVSRSAKLRRYSAKKNEKTLRTRNSVEMEETSSTRNCSTSNSQDSNAKIFGINLTEDNRVKRFAAFQKIVKKTNNYLSFSIPILFAMFNVIYWSWITMSNKVESLWI